MCEWHALLVVHNLSTTIAGWTFDVAVCRFVPTRAADHAVTVAIGANVRAPFDDYSACKSFDDVCLRNLDFQTASLVDRLLMVEAGELRPRELPRCADSM
ncbi:hypothetical protein SY87_16135 [Burkholderia pseudomallei]|nr:hypothetical protein BGI47_12730 [Burkholderia pseudomallei]APZ25628.1 hypothetical protein BGI46_12740 [Burkholderia pseudomallei]KIX45637.1 hypothetical protein SY87_16135 [Burkholderia pseudomallei]OMZ47794.1 hypothetical protein AQ862_24400 [Burkholderia pseudomallei]